MDAVPIDEKETYRRHWLQKFNEALQEDTWGQIVEAQEHYGQLAGNIAAQQGRLPLTSVDKDALHRLILCLSTRATDLRNARETITVSEMKSLVPAFEVLFSPASETFVFPIASQKFQHTAPVQPRRTGEIVAGDEGLRATVEGEDDYARASQAIRSVRGGTVVQLRIERIGLKDAMTYVAPALTVLVADGNKNILDQHEFQPLPERTATHLTFNQTIYLNVSLEEMTARNCAIFFEFKHYKPMKKKISTRCWCFMEMSELRKDEESVLEIYHKPTDLGRKNLKLHSVKQLYLHLVPSFIRG